MADIEVAAPPPVSISSDPVVNGPTVETGPMGDTDPSVAAELGKLSADMAVVPGGARLEQQEVHEEEVCPMEEGFTVTRAAPRVGGPEVAMPYSRSFMSPPPGSARSSVRENILTHQVVLHNRAEPGLPGHISTESRQVMRKGFDLGIGSPALRMMYDTRIKELEEELEMERHSRSKVEKQRGDLQREVAILSERIDEAADSTQAQMEITKRRDADFQKLQRDLEDCQAQNEATLAAFRKKHQDSINMLAEQIDQLHRAKQKQEKERNAYKAEADEVRGQLDQLSKAKMSCEKLCKQYESQLSEFSNKLNEVHRELLDSNSQRSRVQAENAEVSRRLEEAENQLSQFNKAKLLSVQQLEETKMALEDETIVRNKVLADNRNLQAQLEQLKVQLDEEQERSAELQRQLTKTTGESATWRQKFESSEGCIRQEEVDEMKKKFVGRINDSEAQLEAVAGKVIGLEKAKMRLQQEVESLLAEFEKSQAVNAQNEKRQRQFDKLLDEWKRKVADLQIELDNAQKEARSNAAEAYKFKAQLEESHETIETLRRDNKNLSEEIHDLTDVIGQANHKQQEIEKLSKRYEMEKDELQVTLEEAESALEQEEAKVARAQMEVAAIKQEMERRLVEKEEEFETVRKNHQRVIESMQASLETEARNKVEILRHKKKLEQDINDLESALDTVNKSKVEIERNFKKYQQQIRDLQQMLDDEQRGKRGMKEELIASERRATLLGGEIEELKAQIDVLEKTRKAVESDLFEAADRVTELTAANASLTAAKKKLEADIQAVRGDFEEHVSELRVMDDQAKKAMADASRLADELRQEQDHASQMDKVRRGLETQIKELQARVDEAEAAALHGGKKTIQALELRVRELQTELDNEQHRHGETQKNVRKHERRAQELTLQVEEDRKAQDRLHDMIDKMQQKMKQYKKQVEEAEEIAATNLTKYRKIQHDLEESESRADVAENILGQSRNKNRASASTMFINESSLVALRCHKLNSGILYNAAPFFTKLRNFLSEVLNVASVLEDLKEKYSASKYYYAPTTTDSNYTNSPTLEAVWPWFSFGIQVLPEVLFFISLVTILVIWRVKKCGYCNKLSKPDPHESQSLKGVTTVFVEETEKSAAKSHFYIYGGRNIHGSV